MTQRNTQTINVRLYTDFRACNYSCPYCIDGHRHHEQQWQADNFRLIIHRLTALPYRINVRIGVKGEFFLNQTLIEGARILSQADNVCSLNLITNLSFSYHQFQKFFRDFDQQKIALVASYHPTEVTDKKKWIRTACRLKEKYDLAVVLVAYPPLIKVLPEIKAELVAQGLDVFIQAFIGDHHGQVYPAAYTAAEKKYLRPVFYSRHDYEFFVELKRPGLCNAGYRSFFVDMSGLVRSCGMGTASPVLGNLLSPNPDIQLFDSPRPCPNETCLCDTENINTVIFEQHYQHIGRNQHRYVYRFQAQGKLTPTKDEWKIEY
ncbi:hypothetical protein ACFL27_16115 [candidate division CSSED10-310 bacterium]|uniref:Radical SAM protein n=1 Tax=candidate division CSSED10-310 bacterium TaxID=2855610 RepID=A0ABV6Z060_UNCC1